MKTSDWTTTKKYKNPISPQGWAWEFLRRNKEYQADWNRWSKFTKRWGNDESAYEKCPYSEGWVCDPPVRIGETRNQYQKRMRGAPHHEWWLEYAIRQRWGLLFNPIDPAQSADATTQYVLETPTQRIRVWGGWHFTSVDQPLLRSEVAMIIDMALPLKEQMTVLQKYLRDTQRWLNEEKVLAARIDAPRYTPAHLQRYLRILDARAARAKTDTIVETLYPRKRNTYPDHGGRLLLAMAERVANELRDGRYRELVQLKLKPHSKKISAR